MVLKSLLLFLVIAILMDDGTSIKKTEKEEKEDRELAEKVNATLAEEKKREDEEKKKRESKVKVKKNEEQEEERKDKGEALPCFNLTCPVIKPCQPCKEEDCPPCQSCNPCPGQEPCEKCPELGTCPPCERCPEERDCPPCRPCKPCGPCPMVNSTTPGCQCPEGSSLSLPAAMAVGAVAGLVVTGVATVIGLVIRYVTPTISGFLFMAVIILVWYLSSQYPETARELGGRAATLLREAAAALSHRIVDAIRHHNEQVGHSYPNLLSLSSMFHLKYVCTKIFYVEKIQF
jgi:hypothetical protein